MPGNLDPYWATDPNVAPYVWEAKINGIVRWVEYPAAYSQVRFADIGFAFRGRTGFIPGDVHTYVNQTPATYIFTARSLRSDMPHIDLEIAPGDALVWTHRGVMTASVMGGASSVRREGMLFGRERPNGELLLMQMFPDGRYMPFESYASAMATPV